MTRRNNEEYAKRICHYHENTAKFNKFRTVRHFAEEGIKPNTIYHILTRFNTTGKSSYEKLSGRPKSQRSKKLETSIKKIYKADPNISERTAANRLGISQSYLHEIKVDRLGIKSHVCRSAPRYENNQKQRVKTSLRKIAEKKAPKNSGKIIVLDDETYCPQHPDDIPGKKFVHYQQKGSIKDEHLFKSKKKFFKKYLVWQAIDENGNVSKPYISTGTMNSQVYLNQCIKKILIPFINNRSVVFWPDMAPCHYTSKVTEYLKDKNIEFIEKGENAPNCPQSRPIEKFWALCKSRYRARKNPAKNLRSFKLIWGKISKEVANECGLALMKNFRKRLRKIGRGGVYASLREGN